MRVFDTSLWCDEEIENYLLEVLPVNKTRWVTFNVVKGFSLALNSSALGYGQVTSESALKDLPDGIYEFKQSYKPNLYTVQQYYHLRVLTARKKVKAAWDKLLGTECSISRDEFFENRDKLREIEEYLVAAKYKVEECLDKKEGKELYEWALKLLEKYSNECQC